MLLGLEMEWIKIKNKLKVLKWDLIRRLFPKYYWRKYGEYMGSLESENWNRMY